MMDQNMHLHIQLTDSYDASDCEGQGQAICLVKCVQRCLHWVILIKMGTNSPTTPQYVVLESSVKPNQSCQEPPTNWQPWPGLTED